MTGQPREKYIRLYPEIGLAGSLRAAVQVALDEAGHELTASPSGAPGWWDCATRVGNGHRHVSILAAGLERLFLMEFWDWGVMMAKAQTGDLLGAVKAVGLWEAGARLRELKDACPFVEYGPLAEAHEAGEATEAKWALYRTSIARHVDHDLIEAAYAQPRLRALFPLHSHRVLLFSRCIGYPYTDDLPGIGSRGGGTYRVVWWHEIGSDVRAVEEVGGAEAAVALVVASLPDDCGPAVAGNAHDLGKPAAGST
ncbi:DUF6193 family natural product biosynthesis protein [Spirillospora sp. NPDC052269]